MITIEEMWNDQESFMKLLNEHRNFPKFPVDITSKAGQQFIDGIMFHMMKEIFESGLHLKNSKSHRITEIKEIDRDAYVEELVDALKLYIEICIVSGISLDELKNAYMKKSEINKQRILDGY